MSRRVGSLASRQACWGSTVALTPLVCYAEIGHSLSGELESRRGPRDLGSGRAKCRQGNRPRRTGGSTKAIARTENEQAHQSCGVIEDLHVG